MFTRPTALVAATALFGVAATLSMPHTLAATKAGRIDLSTPEGANLASRRVQCSTKDGEPSVYWFHGESFSRVPGERDRKLWNVEGMNVRTCVTVPDAKRGTGWRLVSRELLLYVDPATGKLLETWKNPWTGETLPVLQTANDPVNQRPVFPLDENGQPRAKWTATTVGNRWWNTLTVPLFYKNPLAGDYQRYIGGVYHATEMFNFFGNIDDLTNPKIADPAIQVGWVRISGWLPWMEMGDRAGTIYTHAAGRKLDSWDQLPAVIRDAVDTTFPDYRNPPPGDDTRENDTSWTYFKKKTPNPKPLGR